MSRAKRSFQGRGPLLAEELETALARLLAAARAEAESSRPAALPGTDPDAFLGPVEVASLTSSSLSFARAMLRDAAGGRIPGLRAIELPGEGSGKRRRLRVRRGDLLVWLARQETR